jgi:cbb3-type cytochrome oxidase subunit 1
MEWFVRAFLKASVSWLAVGVTLGVAMIAYPSWIIYRPVHMHINLLGFVTMMIFGVAYHVIPRFSGSALHDRRLAAGHWWIANVGLLLMVAGFVARPTAVLPAPASVVMLAVGGTLSALGAYLFAYNVWRTLDSGSTVRVRQISSPTLPLVRTLGKARGDRF